MLGNLTGWHLLILVVIILLMFGAARLPALAKSLGQSARILKSETKDLTADSDRKGGTTSSDNDADSSGASVVADPGNSAATHA